MDTSFRIHPDVHVLAHHAPVPGRGLLPIQAFLLKGRQPVLIDTGAARFKDDFLKNLESLIDPMDLAWIVLTHPDADHAGALGELLERAPNARLVVNWISTGKLTAEMAPPMARLTWVNPGESLAAGDRILHFLSAPRYDCPSTVSVFDSKSRALFTSDAFGAFVTAPAQRFSDLPEAATLEAMSQFCRANSPWLADTRPDRYVAALKKHADLEPSWLLSAHLPPVEAADVPLLISRAVSFPLEGRVAMPTQQALDAALASAGRAA